MTTTEQRSGFRLPWASEPRPATPPHDEDEPPAEREPAGEAVTTENDGNPEATDMQDTTTAPDPRSLAWPSADATAEPAPAAVAPPAPVARPRRDNPLVAGLVRAMRDAATTARQEAAARFADEAKSKVEALHSRAVDETAEIRRRADTDVAAIREWSKAEMARIREETDRQIADRKARLEAEVEAHAERVEHRVERVHAAIADFERRMDAFFEELLAEEDPARLAGLAEALPEPPSLDIDVVDEPDPPAGTLDALDAASAEAQAFADLDDAELDGADGATQAADDTPGEPDGPTSAGVDVVSRLAALSGPAVVMPEAATSRLAVLGLISVASIAGFKRAVARIPGVRSVTVASGPSGDFIFTVAHDPETDLPSALTALQGYAPVITGEADGLIAVTASDPERPQ
jgi:hypothetical protein